jgi:hypothetical protein
MPDDEDDIENSIFSVLNAISVLLHKKRREEPGRSEQNSNGTHTHDCSGMTSYHQGGTRWHSHGVQRGKECVWLDGWHGRY